MTTVNQNAIEKYRNNFLKEVEERVEDGHMVKMCMQCGVCAGSCPLGNAWEHSPQKIFMMIRAGKRDEVLGSDSMSAPIADYPHHARPGALCEPAWHGSEGTAHPGDRQNILE